MNTKLLTLLLLLSNLSYAKSGVDGNGGYVYECGNSLELVDLKEVEHIPFLRDQIQIVRNDDSYVKLIQEKLDLIGSIDPKSKEVLVPTVKEIESRLEIRSSIDRAEPQDLGYFPSIQGCSVVNVIQYTDRILANADLYNRLSEFDKAALILNGALYKRARINHGKLKNSIPVRRLVALLFSADTVKHAAVIKDLLRFYISHGDDLYIPDQVKFQLCFDKKYAGEIAKTVSLDRFLERIIMKISRITHKGDGKRERVRSDEIVKMNYRCDGTSGESYHWTSEYFNLDRAFETFVLRHEANFSFLKDRELDGRLTLTVVRRSGQIVKQEVYNDLKAVASSDWIVEHSINLSPDRKPLHEETLPYLDAE